MTSIPSTCRAIQLTGPGQLELNNEKPVHQPEGYQILCKVLVVGLCFSDMKLLAQFSGHVRKSDVQSGVDPDILKGLPSYVPGDQPTVPGHETVVEISAIGENVSKYTPGDRFVVQADWRWLKTRESNGAFGYNFEGGLQEYVLVDERLIESPEGEPMFLPIEKEGISLSAFALVEPWACVEESYQSAERQGPLGDGRLLVVKSQGVTGDDESLEQYKQLAAETIIVDLGEGEDLEGVPDGHFDDIVFYGADASSLEASFAKTAKQCLINVVTCGTSFDRPIETPLGDIHYRGIRIFGTTAAAAQEGYNSIPESTEIRESDRIHIVGAGGPMGVMHVMRNICQGIKGTAVVAADLSEERLRALARLAVPAAEANGVDYEDYSPAETQPEGLFDYSVIMAPIPALCADAVEKSSPGAIINIFAGIPAGKAGEIDFNKYIENGLYFFGTSGSLMEDMKIVKRKVEAGTLDTNVSVAAITGLDNAIEGLRAVESQSIPGKILVYPDCKGLDLVQLNVLDAEMPDIHSKLENGVWSKVAEEALLESFTS